MGLLSHYLHSLDLNGELLSVGLVSAIPFATEGYLHICLVIRARLNYQVLK